MVEALVMTSLLELEYVKTLLILNILRLQYGCNKRLICFRLNRRVLGSEPSQYLDLSGVPSSKELFSEDKIHRLLHLSGAS